MDLLWFNLAERRHEVRDLVNQKPTLRKCLVL